MTDLITLTGPLVDHQGAAPLPGVTVTATPSRAITRTSDGKDALTDASTVTAGPPVLDDEGDPLPDQPDEGTFELELVHAAGLRYLITYRVQGKVLRPYVLDCDSWPAGSTVTIADLPPIAGVPPSAVEDLQAWVLEKLAEGMSPETIEAAVIAYLDANPVGIPAHNALTGRDAADQHPISAITGLSDVLSLIPDSPEDIGAATAEQGSKADTAVQPESLHPVATSGQYGDLESLPDLGALPYRPDDWEPNPPDLSDLVVTTDPRLSDARTPTAHKATHATGGTDALTPADIGAATSGHTHAPPDLSGYVPTSRTVNGKSLSDDITLTAADMGASTFSGDYDDLTGKPTLGTAAAAATGDFATAAQGAKADTALQVATAQPINAQTGTAYTLQASDAGKLVTLNNTGAITLNAPGSVFTAGQQVDVIVLNTGMATVVGTSGATANGTPSLVSRARYSAFTVKWLSATSAIVIGDLA